MSFCLFSFFLKIMYILFIYKALTYFSFLFSFIVALVILACKLKLFYFS